MRASGFPESLCVVVPLHHACDCACVQMLVCFHFFECICESDNKDDSESVYGWLLGFTSLELVHYSLTVLPSEIPGSGCVTQTRTHTIHTHTHTQTEKCTHIHLLFQIWTSLFCIVVLYRVTSSESGLLCPKGETDRQTERQTTTGYWTKPLSHFILQDNYDSPCNCVGTAYAVSLFCTHISRWHLRSLPSTMSGSTPFSFFRPSVSEFWICYVRWSSEEQTTQRKNVPKNNLTFNCIFVFALGLS